MTQIVNCKTLEEFTYLFNKQKNNKKGFSLENWNNYKEKTCVEMRDNDFHLYGDDPNDWDNPEIFTFHEWCLKQGYITEKQNNKGMIKEINEILEKTYNNPILRQTTVPTFFSNPGTGKSSVVREFAKSKGVSLKKITLSQRMPMEVVGGLMPDKDSKSWETYDSHELLSLKDGDILFFDEAFNGTLKQTLDAVLNLLEDRTLPTGKKLANVMIVAASNPQGLINLTPQIKERFIRYDLKFNKEEYQSYLKEKYGMPEKISNNLCILINKETFETGVDMWNYMTPRSIEKAINQIGCELHSPIDDLLLPFLSEKIEVPLDIETLKVKKGDEVSYLDILKLFIQNSNNKMKDDNKNQKSAN